MMPADGSYNDFDSDTQLLDALTGKSAKLDPVIGMTIIAPEEFYARIQRDSLRYNGLSVLGIDLSAAPASLDTIEAVNRLLQSDSPTLLDILPGLAHAAYLDLVRTLVIFMPGVPDSQIVHSITTALRSKFRGLGFSASIGGVTCSQWSRDHQLVTFLGHVYAGIQQAEAPSYCCITHETVSGGSVRG